MIRFVNSMSASCVSPWQAMCNTSKFGAARTFKNSSWLAVKFSLGGDQGLDIFALGYPKSEQFTCNDPKDLPGNEPTAHTGQGLTYHPGANVYHYNWKTEREWQGTCRLLVVKLKDGSFHRANFHS